MSDKYPTPLVWKAIVGPAIMAALTVLFSFPGAYKAFMNLPDALRMTLMIVFCILLIFSFVYQLLLIRIRFLSRVGGQNQA